MSREKNTNRISPTLAPNSRRARIASFLSKVKELSGKTDQQLASDLGTTQATFQRWRVGINCPPETTIRHIARTFEVSETELLAGVVKESAAVYEKPLTSHERKSLAAYEALMNSGDDEIVRHLDRQIELLTDLMNRRKMNPDDNR